MLCFPGATLDALRDSCPAIKGIHFELIDLMDEADSIRHCWGFREDSQPNLAGFSGLEELTLDGLCGDLPWWTSQIVQVLKSSPSLHKLRLSLSSTTLAHYDRAGEREEFDDYFDQLCEKYGD